MSNNLPSGVIKALFSIYGIVFSVSKKTLAKVKKKHVLVKLSPVSVIYFILSEKSIWIKLTIHLKGFHPKLTCFFFCKTPEKCIYTCFFLLKNYIRPKKHTNNEFRIFRNYVIRTIPYAWLFLTVSHSLRLLLLFFFLSIITYRCRRANNKFTKVSPSKSVGQYE